MIELVIAVCLIDAPDRCKDVHLTFEGDHVTPQQCMMNGQIEIAKWVGEHPKWQVKRWGCSRAGIMAKA